MLSPKRSLFVSMKWFLSFMVVILSLLVGARDAFCGNLKVTNPSYGTLSGGSTTVTFNLSWDASWRNASVIGNSDAAWVFVKFRKNGGNWSHASLNNTGHTSPSGSTLSTGVVDTSSAFNIATNPVVGVFMYRDTDGSGTFTANSVGLSWNYSQDGVTSGDTVEIRVFAIEMVYVPPGSFFAGDNATSTSSFRQGSSDNDPWWIGSESAISVTNSSGTGTGSAETAAEYYHAGGGDAAGSAYTIPAAFPKGYAGFYMMKGEISQGQWVAFFNTLTATQKATRDITSASGKNSDNLTNRNNVSWSDSGDATLPDRGSGATYEWVAMNYLSWADVAAYLDWAGLRPMSELEYERAGRGSQRAFSGEYAWGDTTLTQATSISNGGLSTERAQNGANCAYNSNASVLGPLRVGSFSYGVATRILSGGGYYGVMELSGNLWERAVTVGTSSGRSFEGRYHGDGSLDANGDPNASTWPGTAATGSGFRGGGWDSASISLQLSDRTGAADTQTARGNSYGGRGVRSVSFPTVSIVSGNSQISSPSQSFASNLVVQVADSNGALLSGVSVVFTGPALKTTYVRSPAASLGGTGSNTVTVTTNGSGQASVAAVANGFPGVYQITASTQGYASTSTQTFTLAHTGLQLQRGSANVSNIRYLDFITSDSSVWSDIISSVSTASPRLRLKRTRTASTGGGSAISPPQDITLTTSGASKNVDVNSTNVGIVFDFGSAGIGGGGNGIATYDGIYELSVDLDNDGTFETTQNFHRLLGDMNGSGIVDSTDGSVIQTFLNAGAWSYQSAFTNLFLAEGRWLGDANLSGTINALDTNIRTFQNGRRVSAYTGQVVDPAPTSGGSGTITIGTKTSSSIALSWSSASDDSTADADITYQVYRSASANIDTTANATANGTVVCSWTANLSSCTASALTTGTTYYFNVVAKDWFGNTVAYTMTSATTL